MSFLAITGIFIAVLMAAGTVIGLAVYQVLHPPKRIISLSPEAFDMKMNTIESARLDALALCDDPDAIDIINKKYNSERDTYKIGR